MSFIYTLKCRHTYNVLNNIIIIRHEMAIELTQKIGRRITTITEDTRERDNIFSNAFPWLCKEEMRFLSTTPW